MLTIIDHKLFHQALSSAQANLENNKQKVNDLNVFPVPDGDTGTNMSLTIQYALNECTAMKAQNISEAVSATSNGALMGARGNSGVILSQLLRGLSKSLKGKQTMDLVDVVEAMGAATEMAYKAVMKPTEGTILTVAREMSEFAKTNIEKYKDIVELLTDTIEEGYRSLNNTPNLLAVLKEAGVVDAGGQGLLYILEGALSALRGDDIVLEDKQKQVTFLGERIPDIQSDIEYGYCTEFLITVSDGTSYEKFLIDRLVKLGDSLLVIQDDNIIKVHVHTNEPWVAMKFAAGCGELTKIKIDNMRQQHRELFDNEGFGDAINDALKFSSEQKKYVIIAVSSGDGFTKILKDLGVDYIIEGGQTMNPSTKEFLDIIESTNAEDYILLPNNKNIILAAQQSSFMSQKNVTVIESVNIPQAIEAMMVFNSEADINTNFEEMKASLSAVQTAQITYASRDSSVHDLEIKEGDIIAVIEGDIKFCDNELSDVTIKATKHLAGDDAQLISIYYGADVQEEDAKRLHSTLLKDYPNIDVDLIAGGQPVYFYVISVE